MNTMPSPTIIPPQPRTLVWRLCAGVLIVNLLTAGLLFLFLQQKAALLEEQATTSARNLALALHENIQGSIAKIDLALQAGADEALRQIQNGGIQAAPMNIYLARLKARMPEPDSLRIADADGVILWGTGVDAKARANITDRDYFQQLRDAPGRGLLLSKPLIGKISKKWVVVFARRIENAEGQFMGVVHAPIDVLYLTRSFGSLNVGKHGFVSLRDHNLTILARFPPPAKQTNIGANVSIPELSALHASSMNEGLYTATSPYDGIERITAYSRLNTEDLNLSVGLAKVDYLAELVDDKRYAILSVSAVFALSLLTASLLWRAGKRKEEALLALQLQEKRMQAFASVSSDWFWELDAEFRFIWFSEGLVTKSKLLPHTLLHRPCWASAHELNATDEAGLSALLHAHKALHDWRLPLLNPEGDVLYFSLHGIPMYDNQGRFNGYLGSSKDVTAKVHSEKHFQHLAHHDALTDLPNRTLLDDRLEQALIAAQRSTAKLALMYIDLDAFKPVNDTHGHAVGDALLLAVAQRMRNEVRASDTVARVGGDEFVVLLSEVENAQAAVQVGEKIRGALAAAFEVEGITLNIGASIGVALYPEHGASAELLSFCADRAMYQAKEMGRNSVVLYSADSQN